MTDYDGSGLWNSLKAVDLDNLVYTSELLILYLTIP